MMIGEASPNSETEKERATDLLPALSLNIPRLLFFDSKRRFYIFTGKRFPVLKNLAFRYCIFIRIHVFSQVFFHF